ncbi:hypothetical protein FACS1894166_09680 [Bacilli bacterium]|nr:hypothetical protein FACS1894166_09680 [Bacilli bacterium]
MPKGKTKTSPKKPQSLNHFSKKKTISLICGITTGVLFAGGVGGVVG